MFPEFESFGNDEQIIYVLGLGAQADDVGALLHDGLLRDQSCIDLHPERTLIDCDVSKSVLHAPLNILELQDDIIHEKR